jgi:hypothetical protein
MERHTGREAPVCKESLLPHQANALRFWGAARCAPTPAQASTARAFEPATNFSLFIA